MKTFAIKLRTHGKFYFRGQEDRPSHRSAGAIIGDASLENSAFYISQGLADLWTGDTGSAEFLDPNHPQSMYQLSLKRKMETDFLIRCGIAAQQTPQP